MLSRLGTALYWVGCALAACITGLGAFAIVHKAPALHDSLLVAGIATLAAMTVWLLGRALRDLLGSRHAYAAKSQPAWEEARAAEIRIAFLTFDDPSEATPERLGIPAEMVTPFDDKFRSVREAIAFVALASQASEGDIPAPVLAAYRRFAASRQTSHGAKTDEDSFAEQSFSDMSLLFDQPVVWAQDWLAEFQSAPDHPQHVATFAAHCLALFEAYQAIARKIEAGPVRRNEQQPQSAALVIQPRALEHQKTAAASPLTKPRLLIEQWVNGLSGSSLSAGELGTAENAPATVG